ncbi:MAG TPA: aldolase/citrate lyase family protein [Steroidobacteraceae bacterium]|nr:aldolase/citrate lyase family protein [Steroidobacteraceae bacterium]
MFNRKVKEKLARGEVVFGTFFKFAAPGLVELFGLAGFDFLIIDGEHATFGHASIEQTIRTCELVGMSSIVRTQDASEASILHALDSGASGIQVPSLRDAEQVREVIFRAKYHPIGGRGWAPGCRAADYAFFDTDEYVARANRDTLVCVHVENRQMVEQIDALCAIEHLDVLFIGTGDLSQSLGHPGKAGHPDVKAAVDKVIAAGVRRGKHLGAVASTPEQLRNYIARGVKYIAWQSDLVMYKNALKSAAAIFQEFRTGAA